MCSSMPALPPIPNYERILSSGYDSYLGFFSSSASYQQTVINQRELQEIQLEQDLKEGLRRTLRVKDKIMYRLEKPFQCFLWLSLTYILAMVAMIVFKNGGFKCFF